MRRRSLVPALLAAALVGCGTPPPNAPPRDLLLVTIDTVRADHVEPFGDAGPGTPRIAALAREGAVFTDAISPTPLTLPAHATLFTGQQPPTHGVRDNGAYRLAASATTLAEALREAGFRTGAFVGAGVLDDDFGLDQGFERYDDRIAAADGSSLLHYPERRGEQVVAAALAWLDESDPDDPASRFAWVHLFDPHVPYRPPSPELERHGASYAGEVAYADRMVGRLVDGWAARRGLERTLVVVTSDHGEALGEHGEATHGVLVHDATLAVPLLLRGPGVPAGTVVEQPVHLVDLVPTLLGLFELPLPAGVQGRDLRPALGGEALAWDDRSGYAESRYAELHHGCAPLAALRDERWKLIRGTRLELYDRRADPGETTDLARADRARAEELEAALGAVEAGLAGGAVVERLELDESRRRMLESLGYVWSAPPAGAAGCDARDVLRTMAAMAEADRRLVAGDAAGAIAAYRALIADEPRSVDGRVRLARILADRGRADETLPLLSEAVAIAPHEPLLHRELGRTLERLGRVEEALAVYEAGLALHPGTRVLRDGRWGCLNTLGRRGELLAELDAAIASDPADATARYLRAVACCGYPAEAYVEALEREAAALPGDPLLERALAEARREADAGG